MCLSQQLSNYAKQERETPPCLSNQDKLNEDPHDSNARTESGVIIAITGHGPTSHAGSTSSQGSLSNSIPHHHYTRSTWVRENPLISPVASQLRCRVAPHPGSIFTNPTLIELRQEISQYHWLRGAVTSFPALARSVRHS
ncbi:hypothetical protein AVEN_229578-1 [Araneus ventricosus]|uniref:Uncharacterized protein n=1 Tax=Araneus ventricosus TaxID=182803 RepID=A0A4Y2GFG7_ARAVE|nr:hypothetical protein AVEN_229578-1 [Araneus ventricosus]